MFRKFGRYLLEIKAELYKATWPWDPKEKGFRKYKELTDSTVIVLVAMVLLGGFVSFSDLVLRTVMDLFLKLV